MERKCNHAATSPRKKVLKSGEKFKCRYCPKTVKFESTGTRDKIVMLHDC